MQSKAPLKSQLPNSDSSLQICPWSPDNQSLPAGGTSTSATHLQQLLNHRWKRLFGEVKVTQHVSNSEYRLFLLCSRKIATPSPPHTNKHPHTLQTPAPCHPEQRGEQPPEELILCSLWCLGLSSSCRKCLWRKTLAFLLLPGGSRESHDKGICLLTATAPLLCLPGCLSPQPD